MANVDWDQEQDKVGNFEVLPKGRYPCRIIESEDKKTKAGDGSYFKFTFEIVKGDYKGRKLWDQFNIHNQSEVAQQIGRERFKALCVAAGKEKIKKTEELHAKFVVCLVDIERGREGRQDQNRINGYMAAKDFVAPEAGPATNSAAGAKKDELEDDDIPF